MYFNVTDFPESGHKYIYLTSLTYSTSHLTKSFCRQFSYTQDTRNGSTTTQINQPSQLILGHNFGFHNFSTLHGVTPFIKAWLIV